MRVLSPGCHIQVSRLFAIIKYGIAFVCVVILDINSVKAYSLLTHEAIIDASWKKSIEPLLLLKYPGSTPEQLTAAHAYAYGGAIMPDIGYSPFGSMLYTDLVHNVRTGDYVKALLQEAADLNEYAFALGSLAHYTADIYGHSVGTNRAVPVTYPKLREEFGDVVTYADHNKSHSRVELAYDVLQTARGNYQTKAYHDFIGFKVSTPLIEKAFFKTYNLNVRDVFKSLPLAVSTYRWVVKSLLPNMVRTAWASKKGELSKTDPGITGRNFSYKMRNKDYYDEFGNDLQKAGFIPTIISVIIPILPKIGPLAKLRFKPPSAETEKLFIRSFDTTLVRYESSIVRLHSNSILLPNQTLDTGNDTHPGEYEIADESYQELLFKLYELKFQGLSPDMKENLIAFYSSTRPALKNRKEIKKWYGINEALAALKMVTPNSGAASL